MKTTFLKLLSTGFVLSFILGIIFSPAISYAQDTQNADTVSAVQDNSSSFNDSVQFDDMEPIFYEAVEEEAEPVSNSGSNIMLYVGVAIVLLIILIVLKKVGKKKS
jgi:hypothetical protein